MSRLRRLIAEVHRRSLWQVLGIYVVGGWIALQVVDTLGSAMALPEWFPGVALALLIVGLPIVRMERLCEAPIPRFAMIRRMSGPSPNPCSPGRRRSPAAPWPSRSSVL